LVDSHAPGPAGMPATLNKAAAVWGGFPQAIGDSKSTSDPDDLAPESYPWKPSIHPGFEKSAQRTFTLFPKKPSNNSPKSTAGADAMSRQFWRAHSILHEIFKANGNFEFELGSNPFTFVDIGCAPGGFSRFLLDHSQCIGGTGLSLPVEQNGVKMLVSDPRMQTVMQDVMQALPHKCFGPQLVDICMADLSSNWNLGAAGGKRIKNPILSYWALLLQELWLGLSVLGHGGIMIFQFVGKQTCTDDWHIDACTCLLGFMDDLFKSIIPFEQDNKSYIICRGFRHDVFLTTAAGEALHQSVLELLEHGPINGPLNVQLFNEMRGIEGLPLKALWIQSVYGKTTRGGKRVSKGIACRQVRQDQCNTVQKGVVEKTGLRPCLETHDLSHLEEQFQKRLLDAAVFKETDPATATKVRVKNTFLEEFSWVPRMRRVASVPACAKLAAFTSTANPGAKKALCERMY